MGARLGARTIDGVYIPVDGLGGLDVLMAGDVLSRDGGGGLGLDSGVRLCIGEKRACSQQRANISEGNNVEARDGAKQTRGEGRLRARRPRTHAWQIRKGSS